MRNFSFLLTITLLLGHVVEGYAAEHVDAAVQNKFTKWDRDISDLKTREVMAQYNAFFRDHVSHLRAEVPPVALEFLKDNVYAPGKNIVVETLDGEIKTTVKGLLGTGWAKSFYDLGGGVAIAAVANDFQPYDELLMHTYYESLGVPVNHIRPAVVKWEVEGRSYAIATYISPTFQSLKTKGIYVFEMKYVLFRDVAQRAAQRHVKQKWFDADANMASAEAWYPILNPMLKDMDLLAAHGLQPLGDQGSFILVEKGSQYHSGSPAPYEARAFPFDFSDNDKSLTSLPPTAPLYAEDKKWLSTAYISGVLRFLMADDDVSAKIMSHYRSGGLQP